MVKYGSAYGSSSLYKPRYPRNKATIAKNKSNAPVKRIYKKPIAKKSSTALVNKKAIMTLSKQVKELQLGNFGFRQWQHQYMSNVAGTSVGKLYPGVVEPCAFMLNDFFSQCPIYQGAIAAQHPTLTQITKWNKVVTDLDLDHAYLWNLKQANDSISQTIYLPVSTTLKFSVQCQDDDANMQTRTVQFTIIKLKNPTVGGTVKFALPQNLGAYGSMLHSNPMHRNHFNTHQYHTIVASKTVSFTPLDRSRQYMKKFCTMKLNFPANKPVQFDYTSDPAGSTVASTIPTKDQYWLLISSNSNTNTLEIEAERWNVWRDPQGVGS